MRLPPELETAHPAAAMTLQRLLAGCAHTGMPCPPGRPARCRCWCQVCTILAGPRLVRLSWRQAGL